MSDPDLHNIDQERAALRARLAQLDGEAAARRRQLEVDAEETDAPRRTRSPVKAGRQKRGPPAGADVIDVDAESAAPEPPAPQNEVVEVDAESAAPEAPPALDDAAEEAPAPPPKKPRGRPRKHPLPEAGEPPAPKKPRGRPRKHPLPEAAPAEDDARPFADVTNDVIVID